MVPALVGGQQSIESHAQLHQVSEIKNNLRYTIFHEKMQVYSLCDSTYATKNVSFIFSSKNVLIYTKKNSLYDCLLRLSPRVE